MHVTAPFNNRRTVKKAQPTNASFAAVNQMLGDSFQLPTTAERVVIKSLCTTLSETVFGSNRKLGGAAERLTDGGEKRICRLSFEF